jgi:hypothetical protein
MNDGRTIVAQLMSHASRDALDRCSTCRSKRSMGEAPPPSELRSGSQSRSTCSSSSREDVSGQDAISTLCYRPSASRYSKKRRYH